MCLDHPPGVQAALDFAYTVAAARRSEQRRILNFIRMSDYMICDTLHTVRSVEPTLHGAVVRFCCLVGGADQSTARAGDVGAGAAHRFRTGGR